MPKKILLLSNPRHGTTFLLNCLNANPDIKMCYELMSLNSTQGPNQYCDCFSLIMKDNLLTKEELLEEFSNRFSNEYSYINNLVDKLDSIKNVRYVGFKIFAQQLFFDQVSNHINLKNLLNKFDKVIFLDRDMTSTAFSWLNARQYGYSLSDRKNKNPNIVANKQETIDIVRETIKKHQIFNAAHEYLDQNNIPYLDLTYNKLGESSVCLSKFLDTDINIDSNFDPGGNNYSKFLSNNKHLSQNISNIDKLKKINDSPKPRKLHNSSIRQNNRLEAINILHTGGETELETQHLCDQISNSLKASDSDKKLAKNIDINIILSPNSPCSFLDSQIVLLKKYFTNVNFIFLKIPKNQDFYYNDISDIDRSDINLDYGLKSGPNIVFFHILPEMKKYNTCLFLELDCYLKQGWLTSITNYTKHCGNFWISGAAYYGKQILSDPNLLLNHHINGGTCLYNTGNTNFQIFIEWSKNIFHILVEETLTLPYDYLIPYLYLIYAQYPDGDQWRIVNAAKQNYLYNNLISNLSLQNDINTDLGSVPGCIIHKKIQ